MCVCQAEGSGECSQEVPIIACLTLYLEVILEAGELVG